VRALAKDTVHTFIARCLRLFAWVKERAGFDTQAGLYSVLMHELGHWTGHPK